MLADVVRSDVRIWVHEEDDVARAIAGTPEAVRALTST
jgi:hypothetical protein